MIDHCIAEFKKSQAEKVYKAYITDALKAIADNTAHHVLPGYGAVEYGSIMQKRWLDVIDPPPPPKEDNRPANEIAADIWKRAGIKKGGEKV